MASNPGFDRVTSQQADATLNAAVVQAVSEAIVTQAFKSAVQDVGQRGISKIFKDSRELSYGHILASRHGKGWCRRNAAQFCFGTSQERLGSTL